MFDKFMADLLYEDGGRSDNQAHRTAVGALRVPNTNVYGGAVLGRKHEAVGEGTELSGVARGCVDSGPGTKVPSLAEHDRKGSHGASCGILPRPRVQDMGGARQEPGKGSRPPAVCVRGEPGRYDSHTPRRESKKTLDRKLWRVL